MKNWIKIILSGIVMVGCKKPYNPPPIAAVNNYLVVEGVINSGMDSTVIKLSRTVGLDNTSTLNPELQAAVTVESDQGKTYPLKEAKNGTYVALGLNLDNSRQYRLRIFTNASTTYLSDFVPVLNSPPIDSISYVAAPNQLNIYANTHDATNKVHYYRWDYKETWMFQSNYQSLYKSNGDTVLYRNYVNDNIYSCWDNDTSSTLVLGSTAKLKADIVSANPITSILSSSEKLSIEYSIIVRQYALTGDAYNFYTNVKKNTENLGSIFDAQPSQLKSNIHSVTNPSEPVIGYLSVGNVSSQRIFIHKKQLLSYVTIPAFPGCEIHPYLYRYFTPGNKIPENQVNEFINYHYFNYETLIPVAVLTDGHSIIGFTAAKPICVDCTLRGINKQPAFWVY